MAIDKPAGMIVHGDGTGDPWGTTLDPALAEVTVDEVTTALDSLGL